jgi:hypothetical protein
MIRGVINPEEPARQDLGNQIDRFAYKVVLPLASSDVLGRTARENERSF